MIFAIESSQRSNGVIYRSFRKCFHSEILEILEMAKKEKKMLDLLKEVTSRSFQQQTELCENVPPAPPPPKKKVDAVEFEDDL